jgi:hypothetical protein
MSMETTGAPLAAWRVIGIAAILTAFNSVNLVIVLALFVRGPVGAGAAMGFLYWYIASEAVIAIVTVILTQRSVKASADAAVMGHYQYGLHTTLPLPL